MPDEPDPIPLADVLRAANDLVSAGLIKDYALGGALAAIYYVEPFTTYDADIIFIAAEQGLTAGIPAIYSYLQDRGWRIERSICSLKASPSNFSAPQASPKKQSAKLAPSNTKACRQKSSVPSTSLRLPRASVAIKTSRELSNCSNKQRSTEPSWPTSRAGIA